METIRLNQPVITNDSITRVIDVLKSGWITQGKKVAEFEASISKFLKMKYAVAVSSATAGLHLSLISLGVGPGDEVIVPSFTWVSTANVVEMCGAKVVFADIELDTLNVSENDLLNKITPKTKVVIPVHLFGKPFDIYNLRKKLPKSIAILEDASCALASKYDNIYCGTLGDIGVFSFHPRKSITTGEGGMIVTTDKQLYQKILMLRNHGQDIKSAPSIFGMLDCPSYGFNYRLTDIQAVLGASQLEHLTGLILKKSKLAYIYNEILKHEKYISLPSEQKIEKHSWQSYVVLVKKKNRDEMMKLLSNYNIETRPGTYAIHLLEYYKNKYNLLQDHCPNSYIAAKNSLALPLHSQLTAENIVFVAEKVKECLDD